MRRWTRHFGGALPRKQQLTVALQGRGWMAEQTWDLEIKAGGMARREISLRLDDNIRPGRQVFALQVRAGARADGSDAFVAVDVGP